MNNLFNKIIILFLSTSTLLYGEMDTLYSTQRMDKLQVGKGILKSIDAPRRNINSFNGSKYSSNNRNSSMKQPKNRSKNRSSLNKGVQYSSQSSRQSRNQSSFKGMNMSFSSNSDSRSSKYKKRSR